MEGIMMQFASPLQFSGDTSTKYTPLVMSSKKSGNQSAPLYFDVQRQWAESDFSVGRQVLAAAIEKRTNETNYRMVVVGDGDFQ